MSGSSLFQPHGLLFAFRAHDDGLQVEEIAVIALVVERFDVDPTLSFIDRNFGGKVCVLESSKAPLRNLRPELAVLLPVQPNLGPARFCVRRKRNGASETVLPMC